MKIVSVRHLLLAGAVMLLPAAAQASSKPEDVKIPKTVSACELSDLQAASACSGYFAGNLNGGKDDKIAASKYALDLIGYTWDGKTIVEKIDKIDSIAFSAPLIGVNFISIHYGGGKDSPFKGDDTTGFYRVETSTALTQLATRYGSLSNAILYATLPLNPGGGIPGGGNPGSGGPGDGPVDGGGLGSAVPEPAVWAQLIMGFGLIGFARRRRMASVAA